jgi:hypothetical protein
MSFCGRGRFVFAMVAIVASSCSASGQRPQTDGSADDAVSGLGDRETSAERPVEISDAGSAQDLVAPPEVGVDAGFDWVPERDATDLPGRGECLNPGVERVSLLPVRGASGSTAMVGSDTELFVSAFDGSAGRTYVWAVPKSGGSPRIVHEDADEIYGLALMNDQLIYAAGGSINRVATRGGQPSLISSAKPGGRALTVLGETLYWAADAVVSPWEGGVFAAPVNGGPSTALADRVRAKGLYILGGDLYAIASDTPADPRGGLLRIPLSGGGANRVGGANFAGSKGMVGVDSQGYVLGDRVYQVDLSTGSSMPLYTGNADVGSHSIVAAGRRLYWTHEGYWPGMSHISGGRVRRFDLDGGGLTEIARCLPKPGPLAVDPQWVYWLNWLSGEILRAPR